MIRLVRDGRSATDRPVPDLGQNATETGPFPIADRRPVELVVSHPAEALVDSAEAGHVPVRDLASAVRSASLTGMSKRALAEAFAITRYQVDKILDQPTEDMQTDSALPLAAAAGQGVP
jgi:hypothetical protein